MHAAAAAAPPHTPTDLVHEGVDGWLFLQAGSNFVTSLYDRTGGNLPDTKLAGWRDIIARRARFCADLGIACAFVIVPDKLTVYGHRTATPLVEPEMAPAVRLRTMMAGQPGCESFVDLVGPMRAGRDVRDLYWRTDTHWTPDGCHLAYETICAHLGVEAVPDLLSRPCREYHTAMDLGWRVEPLRWESVRKYDYLRDARRVWINRITRYLEDPIFREEIHVGSRATFENPTARNPQHAMLIGDSYATPSSSQLSGMFAETFRTLEFVWSSGVDWSFVRQHKPDILIFEIAERFIVILPDDRLSFRTLEWRQALRAQARRFRHWREKRTTQPAEPAA